MLDPGQTSGRNKSEEETPTENQDVLTTLNTYKKI